MRDMKDLHLVSKLQFGNTRPRLNRETYVLHLTSRISHPVSNRYYIHTS